MILFGMINWTFTWLRPDGKLTYGDMARIVSEIFLTGVLPQPRVAPGKSAVAGRQAARITNDTIQGNVR